MKEVDCYKYLEISQMDKTLNDKLIQGVYILQVKMLCQCKLNDVNFISGIKMLGGVGVVKYGASIFEWIKEDLAKQDWKN